MGWLLSFACAVIAAIASCVLAFFIAEKCVRWYSVSSVEGGSGYFVIFMAFFGLVGGFVVGFVVAKSFGTGFLQGTGLALGAMGGVLGLIYLLARMGGDVPPEIDGDELQLMVEMRMAPDWKPSNAALAGDTRCTLASLSGSQRRTPKYGTLEIKRAAQQEGRWIVPCEVPLHSTRETRLLEMRLGKKTTLEFVLPLPPHPEPKHEQWSDWTTTGFAQPVGQQPSSGYAYRVRVKRSSLVRQEKLASQTAAHEQAKREIALLNDSKPLKDLLAFANEHRRNAIASEAQRLLATRIDGMDQPLRDDDATVVYQALEFLRGQETVPVELHPAMIAAGRKVLPLIAKAKSATDPDDPDQLSEKLAKDLGFLWKGTMEKAGLPVDSIKAEIREAAAYAKSGDIYELAAMMR